MAANYSKHPRSRAMQRLKSDLDRINWLLKFVNRDDLLRMSSKKGEGGYAYLQAFPANHAESFGSEIESPPSGAFLMEVQRATRHGLRSAANFPDSIHGVA